MRSLLMLMLVLASSACSLFSNPYEGADEIEREQMRRVSVPMEAGQVYSVAMGPYAKDDRLFASNYAWAFAVANGTPVIAASSGVIKYAHSEPAKTSRPCDLDPSQAGMSVSIELQDLSLLVYRNIKPLVQKGERVSKGDHLGLVQKNDHKCWPYFVFYALSGHLPGSSIGQTQALLFDQIPGGMLTKGFATKDRFE